MATVAVAELPVQDPEEPLASPVTLPVSAPLNVVADNVFVVVLYAKSAFCTSSGHCAAC